MVSLTTTPPEDSMSLMKSRSSLELPTTMRRFLPLVTEGSFFKPATIFLSSPV